MATEAPKTIGEAIEGVTEEDLNAPEDDDTTDDEVDGTTDDDADDKTDDDDSDDASDDEDDSDDESDDDDSDDSDDDDDDSDDDDDADWGVDNKKEDDEETDFFDELSQEQLTEIKKHPELNALRKQLMKGYEKKTTQHANLVKMGEAYRKNPLGVLQAIADQMGLDVVKRGDAPGAKDDKTPSKVDVAAQKLEKLFGDKAGPAVREALGEFVAAVNDEKMVSVNEKLSKADVETEKARFLKEESDFRERHSKMLTPEIEAAVVKLGESGKFAPGKNMSAGEYLDTLLEIAMARSGKTLAKDAGRKVSKKLRAKIDKNKREREPRGRGGKSGVRKVSRLESEPEKIRSMSEAIEIAAAEMEDDFEE